MIPEPNYTLSAIMNRIKQLFDERMHEVYFWMKAELIHVKYDRSGHCYLDIVETKDGTVVAKSTAQIWNYTAVHLKKSLGPDFEQILKPGSEVLCFCKVVFHPVYGLSFVITNVDIQYNLGALEHKKRAVAEQLAKEGLLGKNRQHLLPRVPQRIALIASPNTAGYEDFMMQLSQNAHGIAYKIETFATKVQGAGASAEMAAQLQRIPVHDFDVAVVLRGGGSKFDLEPFNDYELAKAIANYALPVITGIGHETDTSIADLVAHTALKTPSSVGAFLVEMAVAFDSSIQLLYTNIIHLYKQKIQQRNKDLKHHVTEFTVLSKAQIRMERGSLHTRTNRILTLVNEEQARARSLLDNATQQMKLLPLKRLRYQFHRQQECRELLHGYCAYLVRDAAAPLHRKKEELVFLIRMQLKAARRKLEEQQHYPDLYHPEALLHKGFALVRKAQQVVTPNTRLQKGDTVEIELYNRTFNALIQNEPLWKTLPTKKQNRS